MIKKFRLKKTNLVLNFSVVRYVNSKCNIMIARSKLMLHTLNKLLNLFYRIGSWTNNLLIRVWTEPLNFRKIYQKIFHIHFYSFSIATISFWCCCPWWWWCCCCCCCCCPPIIAISILQLRSLMSYLTTNIPYFVFPIGKSI